MKTSNTLEHLLTIEAEAAELVNNAQAEADKRIFQNEEKNRSAFEERFRTETKKRESMLKNEIEELKNQYQKELDEYSAEIDSIKIDTEKFCTLLNEYIGGE